MILILSSSKDRTTQDVCKWLLHFKKKFLVLHHEDQIQIESISNTDVWLRVINKNFVFNLQDCSSYWYRRDNFSIVGGVKVTNPDLQTFVNANIGSDLLTATQYVHFLLLKKKSIASIFNANVNKLNVLNLAQEYGLNIPEFICTGNKNILAKFKEKHNQIIFKTPSPSTNDTFVNLSVSSLTKNLTKATFEELPQNFGLSFFQEQIEKKYEIRTFFLLNKFYSVALISQKNEKTKVDYRNYDKKFPNRNVPIKIDLKEENKLRKLIKALNLDTCSVDWMYTPNGDLYFLEINPVGQFGNVAFHRNDQLEKEIALFLN